MPDAPDLTADLQPTAQEDAPVVIDQRPQHVAVDTNQLNTTPQVVAGRVRVSDDISAQAEEQGYEPDIQPRAAVSGIAVTTGVGDSLGGQQVDTVLPDTTSGQIQGLRAEGRDDEADEIVLKAAAAQTAFADVTAPLSIKTEVRAQELVDAGEVTLPETADEPVVASTAPDVTSSSSGGNLDAPEHPAPPVTAPDSSTLPPLPADSPVPSEEPQPLDADGNPIPTPPSA